MGMSLTEHLVHLIAICLLISVVYATMRQEKPASITAGAAKFFFFTIAVVAGVSAILYIMSIL